MTSAETVYGGGPTAPPLGEGGTLPVTGFEVAALLVFAVLAVVIGVVLSRAMSKFEPRDEEDA